MYINTPWIVCEIIHICCIVFALYLLYALVHYRIIKSKTARKSGKRKRKGSDWLENLSLIGILAALLRFANNQVLVFTGWTSSERCSVLLNLSIALYFIAIHPVYLFLWVRQRIFYSNRALKHLYSKTVRCLSWMALVCFVVTTILSMILFVIDQENSASGRVCRNDAHNWTADENANKTHYQGVKVNIIGGLIGGSIQLSFLALFLYPIMDNKLRKVRTQHMRSGNPIMKLIRRSFLLAGLCIFSDVAIALFIKTIHKEFPQAIFAPLAMYDVNLIINLLCIISTFKNWQVMLLPWFYFCRKGQDIDHRSIYLRTSSRYLVESASRAKAQRPANAIQENLDSCTADFCHGHPLVDECMNAVEGLRQIEISLQSDNELPTRMSGTTKTDATITTSNPKYEYETNFYSDTFLHVLRQKSAQNRSVSLTTCSHDIAAIAKRTKSQVIASLFSKSKSWLIEHGFKMPKD